MQPRIMIEPLAHRQQLLAKMKGQLLDFLAQFHQFRRNLVFSPFRGMWFRHSTPEVSIFVRLLMLKRTQTQFICRSSLSHPSVPERAQISTIFSLSPVAAEFPV